VLAFLFRNKQKLTPWPEFASELYRPSDSRFSAKLVTNFEDRGCIVVSVTDPYGILVSMRFKNYYYYNYYYRYFIRENISRATFGSTATTVYPPLVMHTRNQISQQSFISTFLRTREEGRSITENVSVTASLISVLWVVKMSTEFYGLPPKLFSKIVPGGFVICSSLNHRHSRDYTAIWRHRRMCDTSHVHLFIS
jgi:hypothetical protein